MLTIVERRRCGLHFPYFNRGMLHDSYHAHVACDTIVEDEALSQLVQPQVFLEEILDVQCINGNNFAALAPTPEL
jgi:hypothetical protein